MMAIKGVYPSQKAVFLDRDGTLNVNFGYVHRQQDWEWINGAVTALKSLQEAGFALVIVTNQAGIARGYYQHTDVDALHQWMQAELAAQGISLSGIYFCPHHPEFGEVRQCTCRKPQPGMLLQAAKDLQIDLTQSWIIGDQITDALAGLNAGTKAVVIGTRSIQEMMQSLPVEQRIHIRLTDQITFEPSIEAAAAFIVAA